MQKEKLLLPLCWLVICLLSIIVISRPDRQTSEREEIVLKLGKYELSSRKLNKHMSEHLYFCKGNEKDVFKREMSILLFEGLLYNYAVENGIALTNENKRELWWRSRKVLVGAGKQKYFGLKMLPDVRKTSSHLENKTIKMVGVISIDRDRTQEYKTIKKYTQAGMNYNDLLQKMTKGRLYNNSGISFTRLSVDHSKIYDRLGRYVWKTGDGEIKHYRDREKKYIIFGMGTRAFDSIELPKEFESFCSQPHQFISDFEPQIEDSLEFNEILLEVDEFIPSDSLIVFSYKNRDYSLKEVDDFIKELDTQQREKLFLSFSDSSLLTLLSGAESISEVNEAVLSMILQHNATRLPDNFILLHSEDFDVSKKELIQMWDKIPRNIRSFFQSESNINEFVNYLLLNEPVLQGSTLYYDKKLLSAMVSTLNQKRIPEKNRQLADNDILGTCGKIQLSYSEFRDYLKDMPFDQMMRFYNKSTRYNAMKEFLTDQFFISLVRNNGYKESSKHLSKIRQIEQELLANQTAELYLSVNKDSDNTNDFHPSASRLLPFTKLVDLLIEHNRNSINSIYISDEIREITDPKTHFESQQFVQIYENLLKHFHIEKHGTISYRYWQNVREKKNDLLRKELKTIKPDGDFILHSLNAPRNMGDHYVAIMQGYIHPPCDAIYTFWLAGDNQASLLLSYDGDKSHPTTIAKVEDYTGIHEWCKYKQQKSIPIQLKANTKYYFEAIINEIDQDDHLSVGWSIDNKLPRVISNRYLSSAL